MFLTCPVSRAGSDSQCNPIPLGGYPAGFDKSNFFFITPMESDRRKWRTLEGINLIDRQTYQMAMSPTGKQDKVIPDSFRIILKQFLKKEEAKSLGPDGSPCTETTRGWPNGEPCEGRTRGLLQRTSISADILRFIGKETDRQWEHGEHISLLEQKGQEYREGETKQLTTDTALQAELSAVTSRSFAKLAAVSEGTVKAAKRGKRIRKSTARKLRLALQRR